MKTIQVKFYVNPTAYSYMYDLDELKRQIYACNLWDILKTQELTTEFCAKYILNSDFQLTAEEQHITIDDVLHWQPHLNAIDLLGAVNKALLMKRLYGRCDSFDDFETHSEKK